MSIFSTPSPRLIQANDIVISCPQNYYHRTSYYMEGRQRIIKEIEKLTMDDWQCGQKIESVLRKIRSWCFSDARGSDGPYKIINYPSGSIGMNFVGPDKNNHHIEIILHPVHGGGEVSFNTYPCKRYAYL